MTDACLWRTLQAAYHQATLGKGKERHGSDLPFDQQPIMAIARMQDGSIDGHLFQVMKKAQEAGRMAKRGDGEAATRELYGVIVYAAAAAMLLGDQAPRLRTGGIKPEDLLLGNPVYVEPVASEDGSELLSAAARERRAAIDRAGEKLRAGEFRLEGDNG